MGFPGTCCTYIGHNHNYVWNRAWPTDREPATAFMKPLKTRRRANSVHFVPGEVEAWGRDARERLPKCPPPFWEKFLFNPALMDGPIYPPCTYLIVCQVESGEHAVLAKQLGEQPSAWGGGANIAELFRRRHRGNHSLSSGHLIKRFHVLEE